MTQRTPTKLVAVLKEYLTSEDKASAEEEVWLNEFTTVMRRQCGSLASAIEAANKLEEQMEATNLKAYRIGIQQQLKRFEKGHGELTAEQHRRWIFLTKELAETNMAINGH